MVWKLNILSHRSDTLRHAFSKRQMFLKTLLWISTVNKFCDEWQKQFNNQQKIRIQNVCVRVSVERERGKEEERRGEKKNPLEKCQGIWIGIYNIENHMVNKYMKRCSTTLANSKKQIKMMRYSFTVIRLQNLKAWGWWGYRAAWHKEQSIKLESS